MKLLSKKDILEDLKDAIDTANLIYESGDDGCEFDAVEWIFDAVEKSEKHYDVHKAKKYNGMDYARGVAESRDITDYEDQLDDDFGNLTSEQMSEKTYMEVK